MLRLHRNEIFADRYLLKELLGARGVSEVWLTEDLQGAGGIEAVRIYAPHHKIDQVSLERLRSEVIKISNLSHPNLLPFKRFDVFEGIPYLVMPYIENGSVSNKMLEEGSLPEYEIALLLKQIGSALHYLHTSDPALMHLNIKPDNILIAANGEYLLTDYGISHRTRTTLSRITGQPVSLASAYTPPELFTSQPTYHMANDIFSLGVTLYELCTGQIPWMGSGGLGLLKGASVPYLPERYPRVMNNIMMACMDVNWEKRPAAKELEAEGDYYLENGNWKTYGRFGITTVKVIEYKKTSSLKSLLLATVILLALCATGYYFYLKSQASQPSGVAVTEAPVLQDSVLESASVISENAGNANDEIERAAPDVEKKNNTATREAAKLPAPIEKSSEKPEAVTSARAPAKTTELRNPAPAYPKPSSLEEFLRQLPNEEIPYKVRENWKPDILRYFTRSAAVNYVVKDQVVGILSAEDLVDILLSSDNTNTIRVNSAKRDDAGKIEEMSVQVITGN